MILLADDSGVAAAGGLLAMFMLLFVVSLVIGIYFLPTIIAFARKKENQVAILALNFFLGWTLVGWVISLVWALTQDQEKVVVQQVVQQTFPQSDPTRSLAESATGTLAHNSPHDLSMATVPATRQGGIDS